MAILDYTYIHTHARINRKVQRDTSGWGDLLHSGCNSCYVTWIAGLAIALPASSVCICLCILFSSFLCNFSLSHWFLYIFSQSKRDFCVNFLQLQFMRCTLLNYSETTIFPQSQTNYFQNWIFTPSAKKLLLLICTEFTLSRVRWAPQQIWLGLAKDCLCWCIRDVDDDEELLLLLQFAISTKFKHTTTVQSFLMQSGSSISSLLSPIVCNCIISALGTSCWWTQLHVLGNYYALFLD